jgi:sortase (surface protein transpeptidase)
VSFIIQQPAFFGHSSNNIFNKGKYKFAFVLLSQLQPGDMFYLTYNKNVYAYKVYDKKIVNPEEVWILNAVKGKTATATLITCDPPGTTLHRLAVWGEQVSPDPASNTPSTQQVAPANTSKELTSPPVSLWGRFTSWVF